MTERPILFSAPMVRAILEGRKTQTRRVVKFPRGIVKLYRPFPNDPHNVQGVDADGLIGWYAVPSACPYGQPGDRLWVRETWGVLFPQYIKHADEPTFYKAEEHPGGFLPRWRPSIHMPRSRARIFLEVTAVRVERLQDIGEADATAEGVSLLDDQYTDAVDAFRGLWDLINYKRAPWASNPWVWVVEFRRVSQ